MPICAADDGQLAAHDPPWNHGIHRFWPARRIAARGPTDPWRALRRNYFYWFVFGAGELVETEGAILANMPKVTPWKPPAVSVLRKEDGRSWPSWVNPPPAIWKEHFVMGPVPSISRSMLERLAGSFWGAKTAGGPPRPPRPKPRAPAGCSSEISVRWPESIFTLMA